jgi:TolB-like protein
MSNQYVFTFGSVDLGRLATTAAVALPLLLVATLHGGGPRPATAADAPQPDGPTIAVLPLANPTGDARLGRLADGLIRDVIGDLPRFGVPAIASGTSFGYRDKPLDLRQVGRELGVRYVVEGRLEGDGQRLRAAVDLVDVVTGGQVWSERYDRPLEEFSAIQDELAERIAGSAGGLRDAAQRASLEEARGKPTRSLQAYELWLQAVEERRRNEKEANAKALELLRQALELDPGFGLAYVTLAYTHAQRAWNGYAPYPEVAPAWLEAANRAVELLPTSGWAPLVQALRHVMDNDFARYASGLERAGDLADGDAALMAELANEMPWAGQTARGAGLLDRALRLDPASAGRYDYARSWVYFHARRFEEAAAAVEGMDNPGLPQVMNAAMIYAQLGRAEELERWRSRLLARAPDASAEFYFTLTGEFVPAATAERALVIESLVKAGLPRCATPEQLTRMPDMRRMPECEAERAKAGPQKT